MQVIDKHADKITSKTEVDPNHLIIKAGPLSDSTILDSKKPEKMKFFNLIGSSDKCVPFHRENA